MLASGPDACLLAIIATRVYSLVYREDAMPPNSYDVTGNIKALETLKLELLQSLVGLHRGMLERSGGRDECLESLSSMLTHTYLLASKLGIDFSEIDEQAANNIKIEILKEDTVLAANYAALLRHIRGRKI